MVAVGETAHQGAPLLTVLNRRHYRTFALQAIDWLIDLANRPPGRARLGASGAGAPSAVRSPSGVYIPRLWQPIMFCVTALPESIFQRLRW